MKKLLICLLTAISMISVVSFFSACKEEDMFTMQARIVSIGEKIEVLVLDSQYASGAYWVVTGDETEYFDKNSSINKSQLKIDDVIEISYLGQVMMSYPPQIVAKKIVVL